MDSVLDQFNDINESLGNRARIFQVKRQVIGSDVHYNFAHISLTVRVVRGKMMRCLVFGEIKVIIKSVALLSRNTHVAHLATLENMGVPSDMVQNTIPK